jgi:hypothetical protein
MDHSPLKRIIFVTIHRRVREDRREKTFREKNKKSALRPQRSPEANLPSARFSTIKNVAE